MDRFARLHPVVHFVFFLLTFVFVLSINDPFFSAIALVSALLYTICRRGRAALKYAPISIITVAMVALFNMLFSHYGDSVLFSAGDIDFTLQALFYGLYQGMVLCSVMLWFIVLSEVMDSRRVIYLLRFAPKTALILSMVLGIVPRLRNKAEDIRIARAALDGGNASSGYGDRMRSSIAVLSALVTYSLESSIITARSMLARGYKPTARRYSRYRFAPVDVIMLLLVSVSSAVIVAEKIAGHIIFVFDPVIRIDRVSIPALICFAVLQILPFLIYVLEDVQWRSSASRI